MRKVSVARQGGKAAALLVAGFAFGSVMAFVFISLGDFVGRSGSTGSEYRGYSGLADAWWFAWHYGGALGALMLPLGYYRYLRRQPGRSLVHTGVVAAAVTLAGGMLGALFLAPLSAFTGSAAFLMYCKWVSNGGRFRTGSSTDFTNLSEDVASQPSSGGTPAGYTVSSLD